MKPIALSMAVLVLLCSTAASAKSVWEQHRDDCKKLREAGDQMLWIIERSWGNGRANYRILDGVRAQGESDIAAGRAWAQQLAGIKVDPSTNEPLDCSAIAAKHQRFLDAYKEVVVTFSDAAKYCVDVGDALNNKCADAVKVAYDHRSRFIKYMLMDYVQSEYSAPYYCRASTYGARTGAALSRNGQAREACDRSYYPGDRRICQNIELKNMRDKAKDACKDNLGKIKDPLLIPAKQMCYPTINNIQNNLTSLLNNFNAPNKLFLEATISAAAVRHALINMKENLCDPPPYVPPSGGDVGDGTDPNNQYP